MNLFFVMRDGSIVTPELTGTILEGITRDSIVELAKELGHDVTERRISIDEWREGAACGEIAEVFACGTAAVITPVGRLAWDGGEAVIGDNAARGRHLADALGPARHPVRPRGGHPRLAGPAGLAAGLAPALKVAGVGVHRPSGVGEPPRRQHEAGGSAQMADGVVALH